MKRAGPLFFGFLLRPAAKRPSRCAMLCAAGSCIIAAISPWRKLPDGPVRCFLAGCSITGVFTVPRFAVRFHVRLVHRAMGTAEIQTIQGAQQACMGLVTLSTRQNATYHSRETV